MARTAIRKQPLTLLGESIAETLEELSSLDADGLRKARRERFLNIGRDL